MAALGLAVAFTSPGSVVTVIVLLSMSSGRLRAVAFICGWVLALAVLAALMVLVLNGQDFGSTRTTPSRAASAVEVLLGCLLLFGSARVYRRPRQDKGPQSPPRWLDRLDRTHWQLSIAVGALMLSYALTLAAWTEILRAEVGTLDALVAALVFALTSIVTIVAPLAVVVFAPDRSARV